MLSNPLHAKLTGANLDACFWLHAFKDYLQKHNAIHPATGQTKISLEDCYQLP
jgi:hypothetical protein